VAKQLPMDYVVTLRQRISCTELGPFRAELGTLLDQLCPAV